MSHQGKLFPQKSEEEGEEEEHETCTNLKRPPLREGPNKLQQILEGQLALA